MSLKQFGQKIKLFFYKRWRLVVFIMVAILTAVNIFLAIFLDDFNEVSVLDLIYNQKLSFNMINIQNKNTTETSNRDSKDIVASKNGTKYYFIWCDGISRIKEENRIYFNNSAEAEANGYTIAQNCQ